MGTIQAAACTVKLSCRLPVATSHGRIVRTGAVCLRQPGLFYCLHPPQFILEIRDALSRVTDGWWGVAGWRGLMHKLCVVQPAAQNVPGQHDTIANLAAVLCGRPWYTVWHSFCTTTMSHSYVRYV